MKKIKISETQLKMVLLNLQEQTKQELPFKNNEEGNKFRKWVNQLFKTTAQRLKLDPSNDKPDGYKNYYIIRAYNFQVDDPKNKGTKVTLGDLYTRVLRSQNQVTKKVGKQTSSWSLSSIGKNLLGIGERGISTVGTWLRKISPNVVQLMNPKPLTSNDFTDNQKNIIYTTIQNAIKRTGKSDKGCTEYRDYNSEIAQKFEKKSVQGAEMILRSLGDDSFKMASTLGRFCYKKIGDNKYLATDVYDFKKSPEYSKVSKKQIEDVKKIELYPEKVYYVNKNIPGMDTLYRSIRFIAWTENPQEGKTKGQPITVEVGPSV